MRISTNTGCGKLVPLETPGFFFAKLNLLFSHFYIATFKIKRRLYLAGREQEGPPCMGLVLLKVTSYCLLEVRVRFSVKHTETCLIVKGAI